MDRIRSWNLRPAALGILTVEGTSEKSDGTFLDGTFLVDAEAGLGGQGRLELPTDNS